jgi:hypothetical protein
MHGPINIRFSFVHYSVSLTIQLNIKISPIGPTAVNWIPGLYCSQKAHTSISRRTVQSSRILGPRLRTQTHWHKRTLSWSKPRPLASPIALTTVDGHCSLTWCWLVRCTAGALELLSTGALELLSTEALEHLAVSPVARRNCASRGKASTSYTAPHSPHQHLRGETGDNHDQLGYWLIDWLTGLLKGWMDGWSGVHRPSSCWP